MCISVCLSAHMYSVHPVCAWCPQRSGDGVRAPGTRVQIVWPTVCWDQTRVVLREEQMPAITKLTLQC